MVVKLSLCNTLGAWLVNVKNIHNVFVQLWEDGGATRNHVWVFMSNVKLSPLKLLSVHITFKHFSDAKIFSQCAHLWGEGGKTCTACVSTYSLSSLSEVVIRASPPSYARAASTQINRPAKTCRVGPSCLSSSRQWQCFQVHTRTIRGSDSTRFGQECLVGLNVRRPTARMQAVLLITPDLWELRNESWLDFYLQHWYCTWVSQIIYRSLSRISSLDIRLAEERLL